MQVEELFGLRKTWSEERGNGWQAARDIVPDQVVMREIPLSRSIYTERAAEYCGVCLKAISADNSDPCPSCDSFYVCGNCKNHKMIDDHKTICDVLQSHQNSRQQDESVYSRFFFQLLLSNPTLKVNENEEDSTQKTIVGSIDTIFDLMMKDEGIEEEAMAAATFWSNKIPHLIKDEDFSHKFGKVNKITEKYPDEKLSDKLKELFLKSMYNWHAIPDDDIENDDIGYAVYPNTCYFNHSCSPNTSWLIDRAQGATFCATAVKNITENSEVLISYFGNDQNVSTHRRQDYLQEFYQFTCECDRCVNSRDCYLCEAESKYTCSRCKNIKYCSAECQRKHWPSHKKECGAQ